MNKGNDQRYFQKLTLIFSALTLFSFSQIGHAQTKSLDEIASLLSGRTTTGGESWSAPTAAMNWKERTLSHPKKNVNRWSNKIHIDNRNLLRNFSLRNLDGNYISNVFYPFGGPDAVFPHVLFPNIRRLVLVGLEKPGELSRNDLSGPRSHYTKRSSEIGSSLVDLMGYSYFITSSMKNEFKYYGTLSIILAELDLLGANIINFSYVALNNSGAVINTSKSKTGIRIQYYLNIENSRVNNQLREVIYFQQDLSDSNINASFENFVKSQRFDLSFYKAASYLSQNNAIGFNKLNNLALLSSKIIQTDSGLPFHLIAKSKKNIKFFGAYTKPREMFEIGIQPSLYTANAVAVCNSSLRQAFYNYWRQDPCNVRANHSNIKWGGSLPIQYGYAGILNHGAFSRLNTSMIVFAK